MNENYAMRVASMQRSTREKLEDALAYLRDRIEVAVEQVRAGDKPNALGIIQGQAATIDTLAARLATLMDVAEAANSPQPAPPGPEAR